MWYRCIPMKVWYSTAQVAKKLGMHQSHFQRAIALGKVTAPGMSRVGGVKVRLWNPRDIARAKKELRDGRKPRKAASRRKRR
jgi:hypothetical protein